MKYFIQLLFKELEPKTLESLLLPSKETSLKLHELILDGEIYLIQVLHSNLNTLIDFSKTKNHQVLYFDGNKNFSGASYATNIANGNYLAQAQSKWVMIIPIETSLHNDIINNIEKFKFVMKESNKVKILTEINNFFPLARHTGIGMLSTTIRRMTAEKEFNLPLTWRTGFAISVKTGKRGYEMNELEWDEFYKDLCENLKMDYPTMYDRMFL